MDLKFKDNNKLKLATFIQLEYIESTGTQYIDTGIKPNNNIQSYLKWDITQVQASYTSQTPMGSSKAWLDTMFRIVYDYNRGWDFAFGDDYVDFNNTNRTGLHELITNKNIATLDGVTKTATNYTFDSPYNIFLFTTNTNGAAGTDGTISLKCKIYRFWVKDVNNTTLLDLIPAIDQNNVVCMYDTISQTFFYNQGTGDFVAGPVDSQNSPIFSKITTLYINNCPNIYGLDALRAIQSAQASLPAAQQLSRVRVDIGNVSGSLFELMQFSTLNGFNDNYEPQAKPRLVGTWTINDWYTPAQLAEAQQAFDGLTIVEDPNYVIDFSQMAVQTLDDTQPNYNPAAAIILHNAGYGITLHSPIISGQEGRFFVTKSIVNRITSELGKGVGSVSDTNAIVSTSAISYNYTDASWLKYTSITSIDYRSTGNLTVITLPPTVTTVREGALSNISNLHYVIFPENVSWFGSQIAGWDGWKLIHYKNKNKPNQLADFYGGSGAHYVGIGNRNNDIQCYFNYLSLGITKSNLWYFYAYPQISYDGTDVTITVLRTSTIYYTTDGSTPTEQSTEYTQPFAWDGQGVIKAIGVSSSSDVNPDDKTVYASDFYAQTVATPTITVDVTNNQVILSCATPGAVIYYTTDSTVPTESSNVYTAPITVTEEDIVSVTCYAVCQGYNDSEIVGKVAVFNGSLWGTDADTSIFAVQSIDSTKPNYNPAVCIILNSKGVLSKLTPFGGGYLTKTDAATKIPDNCTFFKHKSSVSDEFLMGDDTVYPLEDLTCLKWATSFNSLTSNSRSGDPSNANNFYNCTSLKRINLDNITTIYRPNNGDSGDYDGKGSIFKGCSSLLEVVANNVTTFNGRWVFSGCSSLTHIEMNNLSEITKTYTAWSQFVYQPLSATAIQTAQFRALTKVTDYMFQDASVLSSLDAPLVQTVCKYAFQRSGITTLDFPLCTSLEDYAFSGANSLQWVHFNGFCSAGGSNIFGSNNSCKIYVGEGQSQSDDNAVLQTYLADTIWATYSSRLDTWYNYLHPQS